MSLVLAYDCAVSGLSVALVRDGATLAIHREEGREQAASLLPAIAATLEKAGVGAKDLSLIAVTIGPGSFTGVRVGLSAARGLAVALGVPLAGLSTTSVLLAQAEAGDRTAVAVVDTRLGDWYCALQDEAPFVASAAQLASRLAGKPCVIVGPDAAQLASAIPNAIVKSERIEAAMLARLATIDGVEAWRARNQAEGLPRPLYLRGVNVTAPDGARHTVE